MLSTYCRPGNETALPASKQVEGKAPTTEPRTKNPAFISLTHLNSINQHTHTSTHPYTTITVPSVFCLLAFYSFSFLSYL
jgi:hypothetical protein